MRRDFPRPVEPQAVPRYSPWEAIFAGQTDRLPRQFVDQFLRSPAESFVPVMAGRISRVWHRPWWLGPAFRLLARHGILVAAEGMDVPMTLTMLPRLSGRGTPYNLCGRVFAFPRPADWDTIKTWDARLGRIVEYVGHHGRLMVVLTTRYDGARLLTFETESIALRIGNRRLWLPGWFWRAFMGTMRFSQVASGDGRTIDVALKLTQSLLGDVFGYEGRFEIVRSDDLASIAA